MSQLKNLSQVVDRLKPITNLYKSSHCPPSLTRPSSVDKYFKPMERIALKKNDEQTSMAKKGYTNYLNSKVGPNKLFYNLDKTFHPKISKLTERTMTSKNYPAFYGENFRKSFPIIKKISKTLIDDINQNKNSLNIANKKQINKEKAIYQPLYVCKNLYYSKKNKQKIDKKSVDANPNFTKTRQYMRIINRYINKTLNNENDAKENKLKQQLLWPSLYRCKHYRNLKQLSAKTISQSASKEEKKIQPKISFSPDLLTSPNRYNIKSYKKISNKKKTIQHQQEELLKNLNKINKYLSRNIKYQQKVKKMSSEEINNNNLYLPLYPYKGHKSIEQKQEIKVVKSNDDKELNKNENKKELTHMKEVFIKCIEINQQSNKNNSSPASPLNNFNNIDILNKSSVKKNTAELSEDKINSTINTEPQKNVAKQVINHAPISFKNVNNSDNLKQVNDTLNNKLEPTELNKSDLLNEIKIESPTINQFYDKLKQSQNTDSTYITSKKNIKNNYRDYFSNSKQPNRQIFTSPKPLILNKKDFSAKHFSTTAYSQNNYNPRKFRKTNLKSIINGLLNFFKKTDETGLENITTTGERKNSIKSLLNKDRWPSAYGAKFISANIVIPNKNSKNKDSNKTQINVKNTDFVSAKDNLPNNTIKTDKKYSAKETNEEILLKQNENYIKTKLQRINIKLDNHCDKILAKRNQKLRENNKLTKEAIECSGCNNLDKNKIGGKMQEHSLNKFAVITSSSPHEPIYRCKYKTDLQMLNENYQSIKKRMHNVKKSNSDNSISNLVKYKNVASYPSSVEDKNPCYSASNSIINTDDYNSDKKTLSSNNCKSFSKPVCINTNSSNHGLKKIKNFNNQSLNEKMLSGGTQLYEKITMKNYSLPEVYKKTEVITTNKQIHTIPSNTGENNTLNTNTRKPKSNNVTPKLNTDKFHKPTIFKNSIKQNENFKSLTKSAIVKDKYSLKKCPITFLTRNIDGNKEKFTSIYVENYHLLENKSSELGKTNSETFRLVATVKTVKSFVNDVNSQINWKYNTNYYIKKETIPPTLITTTSAIAATEQSKCEPNTCKVKEIDGPVNQDNCQQLKLPDPQKPKLNMNIVMTDNENVNKSIHKKILEPISDLVPLTMAQKGDILEIKQTNALVPQTQLSKAITLTGSQLKTFPSLNGSIGELLFTNTEKLLTHTVMNPNYLSSKDYLPFHRKLSSIKNLNQSTSLTNSVEPPPTEYNMESNNVSEPKMIQQSDSLVDSSPNDKDKLLNADNAEISSQSDNEIPLVITPNSETFSDSLNSHWEVPNIDENRELAKLLMKENMIAFPISNNTDNNKTQDTLKDSEITIRTYEEHYPNTQDHNDVNMNTEDVGNIELANNTNASDLLTLNTEDKAEEINMGLNKMASNPQIVSYMRQNNVNNSQQFIDPNDNNKINVEDAKETITFVCVNKLDELNNISSLEKVQTNDIEKKIMNNVKTKLKLPKLFLDCERSWYTESINYKNRLKNI